jgi:predicted MPP superfamily phosphohydrolase
MRERLSPTSLLREAAALFDAPETRLAESTRGVWRNGFVSGADWMRSALGLLRNDVPIKRNINFAALGCGKYSVAIMAALPAFALAIVTKQLWWLAAGVLLFYAVEAQMVFLFPLALDGRDFPFSESRRWTKHAGGTWRVMLKVMAIAATMIFGGFFGRGFVRSWCLGCLAILIWYERLRQQEADGCEAAGSVRRRLEIGATQPLLTRRVRLRFFDGTEPLRLLYASDLHCREHLSRATDQLIQAARGLRPDVIVLGGDLVDSSNGLSRLTETVGSLSACAPVWAIAGNHDHAAGVQEVRAAVERSGGNWLDGGSVRLTGSRRDPIFLDGGISGMMTTIDPNATGRRILCAHDPKIFPEAAAIGYPLVLAGHLHGGQFVCAERRGRLFPGAWFYRWNGDRFDLGQSTLLVSRGVSGTLPLRWNCPREILLCELY